MSIRVRSFVKWPVLLIAGLTIVGALAFSSRWFPTLTRLIASDAADSSGNHEEDDPGAAGHAQEDPVPAGSSDDGHTDPADGHAHDEATTLQLSNQAEANIGRDLVRVQLQPFAREISVPAKVVQRPGRSQVQVTAPFTGLVTRIHCVEGEAVEPGTPLFEVQLTHEELVQAQTEFLRIAEELEVVKQEITRLAKVAEDGAIAKKTVLQPQYEQRKLEAVLHAYRQRLLLHRLSAEQVDAILKNRELLQRLTVSAPALPDDTAGNSEQLMQVEQLEVTQGQHVTAGDPLAILADHSVLHVEGQAFEQDIPAIAAAAEHGWKLTAVFPSTNNGGHSVPDLKIFRLGNRVDPQSCAFSFFVTLPNPLVRDTVNETGQRFIDRQFKPGQRLRLKVPIERATGRIVLPAEAVVQEGVESFVFEKVDGHFDRRPVHVEHRDQDQVVIANDGSLKARAQVAVSGAYQIHLAIKNKGQPASSSDGHAHH